MTSTENIVLETIDFKSKDIKKLVKEMWLGFYEKLEEHKFKARIALWHVTGDAQVVAVLPISSKPDEYELPPFRFCVGIDGLSPLVDKIFEETKHLNDDECFEALDPLYDEFDTWVSDAVIAVWNSKEIQRIHKQSNFCTSRFGVYSINEQDIAPNELHLMKHLAGNKFKK